VSLSCNRALFVEFSQIVQIFINFAELAEIIEKICHFAIFAILAVFVIRMFAQCISTAHDFFSRSIESHCEERGKNEYEGKKAFGGCRMAWQFRLSAGYP
jgi:hypothetical protein